MADELYAHCLKTRDAVVAAVEARFADGRDGEDAWGRGGGDAWPRHAFAAGCSLGRHPSHRDIAEFAVARGRHQRPAHGVPETAAARRSRINRT